jgi:YD repeat-containing protein
MCKPPLSLIKELNDNQGNRIKAIVYGKTLTGTYNDDDELIAYGNNGYQYDQDGFLKTKTTSEGSTHYVYGTLGELRSVTLPDNTSIE